MSKQWYRIDGGRYGGEFTIGTVTPEFVHYWEGREDELLDHIMALDEGDEAHLQEGFDPDSPDPLQDMDYWNSWYEIDDFEHLNNAYTDGEFTVHKVDEEGASAWDEDYQTVSGHHLISREAYTTVLDENPDEEDEFVPVLMFHSAEKGGFGCWYVEIEGEFNPKKLAYASAETDHGEFVERVWYDEQELEANYDWNDTSGKGYYCSVGWFNKRWHDTWDQYSNESWVDAWEWYKEELESEEVVE